jgi:hypothetical protein
MLSAIICPQQSFLFTAAYPYHERGGKQKDDLLDVCFHIPKVLVFFGKTNFLHWRQCIYILHSHQGDGRDGIGFLQYQQLVSECRDGEVYTSMGCIGGVDELECIAAFDIAAGTIGGEIPASYREGKGRATGSDIGGHIIGRGVVGLVDLPDTRLLPCAIYSCILLTASQKRDGKQK